MSAPRMEERVVADIWERQAFDPAALRALGLTVLFRGLPSDAGGPDYQDAVLARHGRELLTGDIEFHVSPADWYAHGHHVDPHYESVVLHVVWQAGEETQTASGRVVPTLVLRDWVHVPLPLQLEMGPVTHPCVSAFAAVEKAELARTIRAAGIERFRQRTGHFSADLNSVSPDQVAYTAILEALGYASNRSAFRALAEAAPYAWLMSLPAPVREAALPEAAGLATSAVPVPARFAPDSWRLSRLRPANHPVVRLQGAAAILNRFAPSLLEGLAEAVLGAQSTRDAVSALSVRTAGTSPIGSGRATEILASAILPVLAAVAPEDDRPEKLYLALPAPPRNRWTRTMTSLIESSGHRPALSRAPDHQGLHWLYHTHCRYERRKGCPVCSGT